MSKVIYKSDKLYYKRDRKKIFRNKFYRKAFKKLRNIKNEDSELVLKFIYDNRFSSNEGRRSKNKLNIHKRSSENKNKVRRSNIPREPSLIRDQSSAKNKLPNKYSHTSKNNNFSRFVDRRTENKMLFNVSKQSGAKEQRINHQLAFPYSVTKKTKCSQKANAPDVCKYIHYFIYTWILCMFSLACFLKLNYLFKLWILIFMVACYSYFLLGIKNLSLQACNK